MDLFLGIAQPIVYVVPVAILPEYERVDWRIPFLYQLAVGPVLVTVILII